VTTYVGNLSATVIVVDRLGYRDYREYVNSEYTIKKALKISQLHKYGVANRFTAFSFFFCLCLPAVDLFLLESSQRQHIQHPISQMKFYNIDGTFQN